VKESEQAKKWLEKEAQGGSELAKAYIGFLSDAPDPVKEHWLNFFWKDVIEKMTGEEAQDGKA
jgi:hypothetical protein